MRRHRLRRTAALGGGSATAATARLRRNRQRRRRNRQLRQNRWRLRRKSAAVTLRRRLRYRRLQPLQRCAAVRIWRREMSLLCACRCSATAFSSPPLGHQVAWSKHLCELQKKLVRNCKEQEVEHVGQWQAFCNREKGGAARVAFARQSRLLHARSHCSGMNMIMLQIGCIAACVKINACCCACW